MMTLVGFTQERDALVEEILPLFKQHARLRPDDTSEDALCSLYIAAAIGAAENYLLRDVFPTERQWSGNFSESFVARHGRASAVVMTNGAGPVTDYQTVGSPDPKTWGFELVPGASVSGATLHASTGWDTFAEMPPDLQQFILVAASAFYEVRELSNSGGSIASQPAAFLPLYLLDSWGNLTYA